MKKPELLAPAGDLNKLKIAIQYGADAVFLGGQEFGLRSNADNFSIDEIREGVEFANAYGAKVYVTTNIFAHAENFNGFREFVERLEEIGVTGLIISDPGYIHIAKKYTNLEIHISTQHSIMNSESVRFWENFGVDRVVLGRELSGQEIKNIVDKTNTEIEIFIHGAVCSSYSGRCTLSNHMTLRDSNRGGCTQSCRWNYEVVSKDATGNVTREVTIPEGKYEQFNMSAKDMNLLAVLPEVLELGVDSLKVEGRMKSFHYVATVIKVYRAAIDAYFDDPENYELQTEWVEEIAKAESRPISAGSFSEIVDSSAQIYGKQYQDKKYDYCGIVLDYDKESGIALIEQRNLFEKDDVIEITGPGMKPFRQKVEHIWAEDGEEITRANHPLMRVRLEFDREVKKDFILRKEN